METILTTKFIRHGETNYLEGQERFYPRRFKVEQFHNLLFFLNGSSPHDLTEKGVRQAMDIAFLLQSELMDNQTVTLVSSDAWRALSTARIIKNVLQETNNVCGDIYIMPALKQIARSDGRDLSQICRNMKQQGRSFRLDYNTLPQYEHDTAQWYGRKTLLRHAGSLIKDLGILARRVSVTGDHPYMVFVTHGQLLNRILELLGKKGEGVREGQSFQLDFMQSPIGISYLLNRNV